MILSTFPDPTVTGSGLIDLQLFYRGTSAPHDVRPGPVFLAVPPISQVFPGAIGFVARSHKTGVPAQVIAQIWETTDGPLPQSGIPQTASLTAGGGISCLCAGGGASLDTTDGVLSVNPTTELLIGAGLTLTNPGAGIAKVVAAAPGGVYDGWHDDAADGETWTYASVASFTVPGDVTLKYGKGTYVKCTQTTVKYFVVIAAVFSAGTTTVTVTGGTDYALANAAITANAHSYSVTPQGFPAWFNYTPTLVGFSGTPTTTCRFTIVGRKCTVHYYIDGTSNSVTFTFTPPVVYGATGLPTLLQNVSRVINNGTDSAGTVELDTANPTPAVVYSDVAGSGWTNSGHKQAQGVLEYEI